MKINRYVMTSEEDEDTTRYNFARASQLLREVADSASGVFLQGRPLTEEDLRQLHSKLESLWDAVVSETLHGIAPSSSTTDAAELESYYCHYSDGSPVVVCDMDYEDPLNELPRHFRQQSISYIPGDALPDRVTVSPHGAGWALLKEPPHERPAVPTGDSLATRLGRHARAEADG